MGCYLLGWVVTCCGRLVIGIWMVVWNVFECCHDRIERDIQFHFGKDREFFQEKGGEMYKPSL